MVSAWPGRAAKAVAAATATNRITSRPRRAMHPPTPPSRPSTGQVEELFVVHCPPVSLLSHKRAETPPAVGRSAGRAFRRRPRGGELHGDAGPARRRPADAEGAAGGLGRPPGDVEAEAGPAGAADPPGHEVGGQARAGVLDGQRAPRLRPSPP